jgi:hypothetical protein
MVAGGPSGKSITNNGSVPNSDASPLISGTSSIALGSIVGNSSPAYGNFNQLAIWNNLVASTAEMQRLTT